MVGKLESEILPQQTIAAQQIGWGTEMLEVAASNNLFPMLRLYGCNVAGSSNLGTILAGTRQATELGTSQAGAAYIQVGSAVTFNEPWRLVAEWGVGGLPVNTATDTHNASIVFGDPFATGTMNLIQQTDTSNATAMIVFSNDIIRLPLGGGASYNLGI